MLQITRSQYNEQLDANNIMRANLQQLYQEFFNYENVPKEAQMFILQKLDAAINYGGKYTPMLKNAQPEHPFISMTELHEPQVSIKVVDPFSVVGSQKTPLDQRQGPMQDGPTSLKVQMKP
jgi:hypothetical protein